MSAAAYRDVMLDWAIAELMSPYWRTVQNSEWSNPGWESWREQIRRNAAVTWTGGQADLLIAAIRSSRKPIIDVYGPNPDQRFWKSALRPAELAQLQVMPEFFPPGGVVAQLANWIRTTPAYAPEKNVAIEAMTNEGRRNRWPYGSLIVRRNPDGSATLIEGYKRAMAAISGDRPATPVYLYGG